MNFKGFKNKKMIHELHSLVQYTWLLFWFLAPGSWRMGTERP
jgi:hypothetical protein